MASSLPELPDKPYHPPAKFNFPIKKQGSANRRANYEWFIKHPWLHYESKNDQVFCYYCIKAVKEKKNSSSKMDSAFVSSGFTNWKRATDKFKLHENAKSHKESMLRVVTAPKSGDIGEMLNSGLASEKQSNRKNFMKILTNVRFLAKQNLAFRKGGNENESNFIQLLKLRSEDDPELSKWMEKTRNKYISPENQNEILQIMSRQVLNKISDSIHKSDFYSIMIDETPDLSNKEQAVICFRYVDDNLEVFEDFFGLYQVETTKSDDMMNMVKDVLLRLNISFEKCRGQCFDGARNMSGNRNGLATQIQRKEKRALYTHCYGHALNLACNDTIKQILLMKNALDYAHEIVQFVKSSPKRFAIFNRLKEEIGDENIGVRVLCNTRWTVRADSLESILNNYGILFDTFEQSMEEVHESRGRAVIAGILANMRKFETYFGLNLAKKLLRKCDNLSKALQNPKLSASDGQSMAKATILDLKSLSCDEKFEEFWDLVTKTSADYDIDEPLLPRPRKKPKRFESGENSENMPKSAKEFYNKIYLESLEVLVKFLEERFAQEGFETYKQLENLILKAARGQDYSQELEFVTDFYGTDFSKDSLKSQLETFGAAFRSDSESNTEITFQTILKFFKEKSPEIMSLLSEVKTLLKLILVMPATNATSERSFSALKRIKSYLRTLMGQERLNNLMVLHVHKDYTESLDLVKVANDFVAEHEYRLQRFGTFV